MTFDLSSQEDIDIIKRCAEEVNEEITWPLNKTITLDRCQTFGDVEHPNVIWLSFSGVEMERAFVFNSRNS